MYFFIYVASQWAAIVPMAPLCGCTPIGGTPHPQMRPQYSGMHPHRLGYPSNWGCIGVSQHVGMNLHGLGSPSIWGNTPISGYTWAISISVYIYTYTYISIYQYISIYIPVYK